MKDLLQPILFTFLTSTAIGIFAPNLPDVFSSKTRATDICKYFSYEKYPYNCTKFYFVCPKPSAANYLMYCAEGDEYSIATKTCAPASEANCQSINGEPLSIPVPYCTFLERYEHPGDCSKFYQCVDNRLFEMDCPAGFEFSSKFVYGLCLSPKLAKCYKNVPRPSTTTAIIPSTTIQVTSKTDSFETTSELLNIASTIETTVEDDTTTAAITPTSTSTEINTTIVVEETTTEVLTLVPSTTSEDDTTTVEPTVTPTSTKIDITILTEETTTEIVTLVPSTTSQEPPVTSPTPSDTSTTETTTLLEVSTTTITSVITESTTEEQETTTANTEVPITITTTTDDPITTTSTTQEVVTSTTEITTTKPSSTTEDCTQLSQVDCKLGMYHAHPTDCDKFYQCANGRPILMYCPADLHFNILLNVCDWPYNVGCTPSIIMPCSTTTSVSPTMVPSGECELGVVPCWEGVYHPHPTDCKKFCQCSNGIPYEHDCAEDMEFNPELGVCDWPEVAGCHRI